MLLRLFAITSKEVRQLARDRLTFGMIIGIPLMQILLFGYAINFDVRDLDAAVVDEARTSHSRALVADLQATGVIVRVAKELGIGVESLRQWVNRAEIDAGRRQGTSTADGQRIAELTKENRELRRANDILKAASIFFATELDGRPKR